MSDVEPAPLTNVSIQTFASEADRALHDERWAKIEEETIARLKENGLVSFKSMKVWNKGQQAVDGSHLRVQKRRRVQSLPADLERNGSYRIPRSSSQDSRI